MQLTTEKKRRDPIQSARPAVSGLTLRRKRATQRAVLWSAAVLAGFLFIAAVWAHPEWRRHDTPAWWPLVERADAAAARDDRYAARHLYIDAARAASSAEDWKGLLAAACGMKKVDGTARARANTHFILVRAMTVAESERSRTGMQAVARAFSSVGEEEAAGASLGRVQPEWPGDAPSASDAAPEDCWGG